MPDPVDSVVTCDVVVFKTRLTASSDIFENEEIVQQD